MISEHMHQDIARSSYADMLNDDERNFAYSNAIELSVTYLVTSKETNPDRNRYFKCCDIGTGSGLLSMMIVRSFKKLKYKNFHVTAFEAFQPMAECAQRVIDQNDMSEYITVIPTRSDCRPRCDNPEFDLLVAELLDTELIGEGCLGVYHHAIKYLCSPKCLFIPHLARIYLEPVASARLFSRHAIDDLNYDLGSGYFVNVPIPDNVKKCPGAPEIDDMQVSALKEGVDFHRFSKPKCVFEFTFGNLETLKLFDYKKLEFDVNGMINEPPVIIMWWDIVMYDKSLIMSPSDFSSAYEKHIQTWEILSCSPTWARSYPLMARDRQIKESYGRDVWREHWIQGVYYFGNISKTKALLERTGGFKEIYAPIDVHAYHDGYSLWFDLEPNSYNLPKICGCGAHRKLGRSQLALLSNPNQEMTKLIRSALETQFKEVASFDDKSHPEYIAIGEIEFSPGQEEALGDSVLPSSSCPKWQLTFRDIKVPTARHFPRLTRLHPEIRLTDLALVGEIPWTYMMTKYLDLAAGGLLPQPVKSFEIKFTQVQFDNLNRIRTNIRECQGFNLSDLDDMINYSSKYVDKELEAHYLWEYPCTRIDSTDYTVFSSSHHHNNSNESLDQNVIEKDLKVDQEREKINSGTYWRHFRLPLISKEVAGKSWQKGWALAFWVELRLEPVGEEDSICERISLGPLNSEGKLGERIEWNPSFKQSVYFLHDHPIVAPQTTKAANSDDQPSIHLDVGLSKCQLMVQRAVDYNTSPLKSKRDGHESN